MEGKIHHTMGVYNNGARVHNGVRDSDLQSHIKYNIDCRPGRALFVNGVCHHRGYLGGDRCMAIEDELKLNPVVMPAATLPYR